MVTLHFFFISLDPKFNILLYCTSHYYFKNVKEQQGNNIYILYFAITLFFIKDIYNLFT